MNKRIILFFISTLLFGSVFSQKKTSMITLIGPLIKKMEFRDTSIEGDREIYHKCQKWKLNEKEVYKLFSYTKLISSEEKSNLYYWLPCYYTAEVIYKDSKFTMEINAASFIVLFNKRTTQYFGCSLRKCRNFFVLPGGNASEE